MPRSKIMASALTTLLLSGTCQSADIKVNDQIVTVTGDLKSDDFVSFWAVARDLDTATIVLQSEGGNLWAATRIGELIRKKGFATRVDSICNSACALIWASGNPRVRLAGSHVGFHSPHNQQMEVSNAGIELAQYYLRNLGFTDEAIKFMTICPPRDLNYLTEKKAKELKIEMTVTLSPVIPQKLSRIVASVPDQDQPLATVKYEKYDQPKIPMSHPNLPVDLIPWPK